MLAAARDQPSLAWARKRVFEINPVTGSLQIVNVSEAAQAVPPKSDKKKSADDDK